MSAQPFRDRYRTNLDLGHAGAPERNLWAEVLRALINDALIGATSDVGTVAQRVRETKEARLYFTRPNRSLRDLCDLIGLDHVAVRDRMIAKITQAPTPEELLKTSRRKPAATLIHDDEELTVRQWAKRTGLPAATINARINMGWSASDILTTPVRRVTKPADRRNARKRQHRDQTAAQAQGSAHEQDHGPTQDQRQAQGPAETQGQGPAGTPEPAGAAGTGAQGPGVGQDFGALEGTGAGTAAQVLQNINFSECESTT